MKGCELVYALWGRSPDIEIVIPCAQFKSDVVLVTGNFILEPVMGEPNKFILKPREGPWAEKQYEFMPEKEAT